jgi:repressor LexA
MKQLHTTQLALLELLKENITDPLTVRDLQDNLGISSPSVVYHHLRQLEKKGYLKRNPHNPKDYQVLTEPDNPIVYLNLYGMAQCGPNGLLLDGTVEERVPISRTLLNIPAADAFLVKTKGDSMEPKIKEGDLVIAQKNNVAEDGDTVVCVHDLEAKIKKFFRQKNTIILQSENVSKYPPILAEPEDVKIEGIVKGVIQYN